MAIISPLPFILQNGTNADASQVMADLNQIVNSVNANAATFPTGTRMLFHQTNSPVGWTKETGPAFDNKAMRIVTGIVGSGGATDFTQAFSGLTGNFSLTTSTIPPHVHTVDITSGFASADHSHNGTTNDDFPDHSHVVAESPQVVLQGTSVAYQTMIPGGSNTSGASTRHQHSFSTGGQIGNHQHNVNGLTGNGGLSGGPHAHQMPNLAFHDVIIAVKS